MFRRLDFLDKNRYDTFLLESKDNPFPEPPARNQVGTNPAKFLVGRSEQLQLLDSIYREAKTSGEPKLSVIQGSQGVGKSSLISWFVREKQRLEKYKLFLVVYEMTSRAGNLNFEQFYDFSITSLYQNKDLYWIGNRVLVKILHLWEEKLRQQEFIAILQKLKISNQAYFDLKNNPDLISNLANRNMSFISQFWDIFQTHFHEISFSLPTMDFSFLEVLFYSIYKNSRTFEAFKALSGKGEFQSFEITNENKAKQAFRTLTDLLRWISDQALIVVVFDHLEAAVANPSAYIELFSLLLQLRQQNHLLILLSGTFDAFNSMDMTVQEDMSRQINNWSMSYSIKLSSLTSDEVIQILTHHLSDFWSMNSLALPSDHPQYPYSSKSINYLYLYNNSDLRQTLETCYYDIKKMKEENKIIHIDSVFDAFKRFRIHDTVTLRSSELKLLRNEIMDSHIQDKSRASQLEIGIYNLLNAYAKKTGKIYNVRHEPRIGKKKLKPDVYFEVGQGLGNSKIVAIEVKLYRVGEKIPAKEIKKTHSLLTSGDIDYLIWYSNQKLDQSKHQLDVSLWPRVGRDEELSDSELGYAGLIYYYEEIMPHIIENPMKILQLLKSAGIDLDYIITQTQSIEKATEIKLPEPKNPSLDDYIVQVETDQETINAHGSQSIEEIESEVESHDQDNGVTFLSIVNNEIQKNNGKSFCSVNTIIKGLESNNTDLSDFPNNDDLANKILKIAEEEGYRTTATRIYFK